jgi:hypothetical protein
LELGESVESGGGDGVREAGLGEEVGVEGDDFEGGGIGVDLREEQCECADHGGLRIDFIGAAAVGEVGAEPDAGEATLDEAFGEALCGRDGGDASGSVEEVGEALLGVLKVEEFGDDLGLAILRGHGGERALRAGRGESECGL